MSLMMSLHHVGAVFTAVGLSFSCYSSNWPYDSLTDCSDIVNNERSMTNFNLRKCWSEKGVPVA